MNTAMSATTNQPVLSERIRNTVLPHLRFLEPNTNLSADDNLAEFGLDSLASINLLFDLEMEFGIEIPDDAITDSSFATLCDIERTLSEVLS